MSSIRIKEMQQNRFNLTNKRSSENYILRKMVELSFLCVAFVAIRIIKASQLHYLFLIWNLFLAWIPYLISRFLVSQKTNQGKPFEMRNVFYIGIWLLFLPNAAYILTDLFHLKKTTQIPQWFDLLMILSFAITGLLLFLLSVAEVRKKIGLNKISTEKNIFSISVCVATGYGIYLGRYLRFNSWDILSDTTNLIQSISYSIFSEQAWKETLSVTLFFAAFLFFACKLFSTLTENNTHGQDQPRSNYH